MNGFRTVTAGSCQILTCCGWFRVVEDGLGRLQMVSSGSFWMVADGFGWLQVVLGGLGWFSVLVAMVFIYTEEEINHLKLLHLCYILVLLREVAIYI